jgi:CRISPR/Cas system CSM-associated protein Csm3 (group 7 of RAMP superfamily)
MTGTPRPILKKDKQIIPPEPPSSGSDDTGASDSKPYRLIPFAQEPPQLYHPAGHDKYLPEHLHGTLFLTLKVQTPVHISTGVVVMGSDVNHNRIPLVKTMVQDIDQKLVIQGSSLKGCIRSVYEVITNSTLAVVTPKYRNKNQIPKKRLPCNNKENLCPASRVFGALNWQGLIDFTDAMCEKTSSIGFMPSLYKPQPEPEDEETRKKFLNPRYFDDNRLVRGRKFYYHTIKAIDKGQQQGIPVLQAGTEFTFTTQLQFMNLKSEELGALLITLGQDPNYKLALKVGGGKPIGMGTMTVEIVEASVLQSIKDFSDRYSSYTPSKFHCQRGDVLGKFIQEQIQKAHSTQLIHKSQLDELLKVLYYPTDREPPSGMY